VLVSYTQATYLSVLSLSLSLSLCVCVCVCVFIESAKGFIDSG
jgi:hypothetical protein